MKQFSDLPNERKEIKNFPVSLTNENVFSVKPNVFSVQDKTG